MLNRIGWERTPLALRVGILITIAAHLGQIVVALALGGESLRDDGFARAVRGIIQAAWVTGDVLGFVGSVALARRSPRAWTLVAAYSVGLALYLLWVGIEALEMRGSFDHFDLFEKLRWLEFASNLLAIVAWLVLARNAGLIVALVVGKLLANLPPVFDNLYSDFGISSFRAMVCVQTICNLVAMLAALAIAMGVPFERPVATRALTGRALDALAAAAMTAGGSLVLLDWGGLGDGMQVPLVLVAIGALAWFAVNAARLRGEGESGGMTLMAASAAAVLAAVLRLDMVPSVVGSGDVYAATFGLQLPMLLVPLLETVALVLALSAVTRIARGRGAERVAQIASACALVALVAGLAAVAGARAYSHLGTLAQVGGTLVAYAAAAYGLHAGARALGDGGELPTATLRA
jgi:hypothetical protein